MGEGLSFSKEENQEADKQNYTVNNFYNAFGVQIQQHTQHSTQIQINEMDLEEVESLIINLQKHLTQIGLNEDKQKVIESEIDNITKELEAKNPKVKLIRESMKTIKNLLEGVAGNFIAQALLAQLGMFK